MAAPTIGAYTTQQRTSNGTSLTVTVPTYDAGNVLYVAYADDADAGSASIDGADWTAVVSDYTIPASGVADSGSFYLWKKPASGSSHTITSTVSERAVAVAFVVIDDGGINVAAVSSNDVTSAPAIATLVTSLANCLRISIVADSADRTPIGTFGGHTVLVTHASASAGTLSIQSKALPSSGSDAGVSTTQASTYWTTHTFAIAPLDASVTVAPAAATMGMAAVSPTVLTDGPVSPAAAATKLAAVAPTVVHGAVIVAPAAATMGAAGVSPTVVHGAVTVAPAVAATKAVAIAPTVVHGAITLTPAVAATKAAAVSPTVTALNGLLDNLVAFWGLDEAGGANNALDKHSGARTLTQHASPGSAAGKVYATARTIDGATQYFSRADETALQGGDNDITWAAWIYLTSFAEDQIVLAKADTGEEYYLYYQAAANRLIIGADDDSGNNYIEAWADTFGDLSINTWYLVIASHDAVNDLLSISVNNSTPDTAAFSTGIATAAFDFTVGGMAITGTPASLLIGRIGPVMMWKSAPGSGGVLTPTQRTNLYSSGAGIAYTLFSSMPTAVTVTPAAAATKLAAVDPAVVHGAVAVAPAAATTKAAGVSPTVVLGAVTVAPAVAATKVVGVSPTAVQGAITLAPALAATKVVGVSPTTVQGAIALAPAVAATKAVAVAPTVVHGPITIAPAVAVTKLAGVAPTVVLGAVAVAPAIATTKLAATDPATVQGAITLTPAVATTKAIAVAPTVLTPVTLAPAAATAALAAVAPTVVLGAVTVTPAVASMGTAAAAPTVVHGALTLVPAVASVALSAVAPSVVYGAVAIVPPTAASGLAALAPTIVYGAVAITPAAAATRVLAVAPTLVYGSIVLTPAAAATALAAAIGSIITGSAISLVPAVAETRLVAPDPTVIAGFPVVVAPAPAVMGLTAAAPVVVLGAIVIVPTSTGLGLSATTPTIILGAIVIMPAAAVSGWQATAPTVVLGAIVIVVAPAATRLLAGDPAIEQGMAITIAPEYAGFRLGAVAPVVVLGGFTLPPASMRMRARIGVVIAGLIVAVGRAHASRSTRVAFVRETEVEIGPRAVRSGIERDTQMAVEFGFTMTFEARETAVAVEPREIRASISRSVRVIANNRKD